jgi:hypothetical protein
MVGWPLLFGCLLERFCVLEHLGPFLLAVLFEQSSIKLDAAAYFCLCCNAMLVANLDHVRMAP